MSATTETTTAYFDDDDESTGSPLLQQPAEQRPLVRNLFPEFAVQNIDGVDVETLKRCIELYKTKNDNGKLEDVNVVILESNATAHDIKTLIDKYPSELKGVGLDVDAEGRLVIVKFSPGPLHQGFVSFLHGEVHAYIRANPALRRYLINITDESSPGHLGGKAPDEIICGYEGYGNARLAIEVDLHNMSVEALQERGRELFRNGPELRVVLLIKIADRVGDNFSAVAVCYKKDPADRVTVHDAVSFGSVDNDDIRADWTIKNRALPAVRLAPSARHRFRICVYPAAAAVMIIPLSSFFYHMPQVPHDFASGRWLDVPAGAPDLQLDLRELLHIGLIGHFSRTLHRPLPPHLVPP